MSCVHCDTNHQGLKARNDERKSKKWTFQTYCMRQGNILFLRYRMSKPVCQYDSYYVLKRHNAAEWENTIQVIVLYSSSEQRNTESNDQNLFPNCAKMSRLSDFHDMKLFHPTYMHAFRPTMYSSFCGTFKFINRLPDIRKLRRKRLNYK